MARDFVVVQESRYATRQRTALGEPYAMKLQRPFAGLDVSIGGWRVGGWANLIFSTFGVQHGNEHVAVTVTFGPVCTENLSEAWGWGLRLVNTQSCGGA
jgi:hypothetical protein